MYNINIKEVIKIAELSDWNLTIDNNEYSFSTYSPQGQDFYVDITADTVDMLLQKLYEYYNCYDCSEQTYLWLDETGHGASGAPYDMRDIYNDMEDCKDMVYDLWHSLKANEEDITK